MNPVDMVATILPLTLAGAFGAKGNAEGEDAAHANPLRKRGVKMS